MQTKGGFTYKILCYLRFFHYLCGNSELTHGRILMLIHIESESHTCIWPLFPAVIFEIVQQAFFFIYLWFCVRTWLSITNWKIHSKVTLLPCMVKKHSTIIQIVYMSERERAIWLVYWLILSSKRCASIKKGLKNQIEFQVQASDTG